MTLAVRFSAEAEAELESAAAWYEDRRVGLGEEFLDAVERTIDQVAEWPLAGRLIEELPADIQVRRAPVDRFPYHLAYLIEVDHARVLAVAHDRRRPLYWAPRAES